MATRLWITGKLLMALIALSPGAARAKDTWMANGALQATFAGKSVKGHYSDGSKFDEAYEATGEVRYRDETRANGGQWSIVAGTFCTIYDNDLSGGCFRVRQESANCYEFYFVARTEEQAEIDPKKPDWTAQVWFAGTVPTCSFGENV